MNKSYITIAEYAKIKSITPQAVYKQLNNKLKDFLMVVEGQKCLKVEVLGNESKPVVKLFDSTVDNQLNQSLNDTISVLESQIKEKDQQIKYLQDELTASRHQIEEYQNTNKELQQQLMAALIKAQELTQNSQVLLLQEQNANKKGLFKRLFSKKEK